MVIPNLIKNHHDKKKEKKSGVYRQVLYPDDFRKKATFINVTIVDASEAVYGQVHSALRHLNLAPKLLPKLKGKVANKIATVAAKRVPPSKIAHRLADQLPKMLMYQMYHKHGMTISAQTMFIEDAFIVVQLQVRLVDANRLLEDPVDLGSVDVESMAVDMKLVNEWVRGQQQELHDGVDATSTEMDTASTTTSETTCQSNWYQSMLGILPEATKTRLEAETLPQLVQSKLTERMQILMLQQLESKNLTAEIAVLPEEQQARFFFPYLQQVRKRKAKGKQKGKDKKNDELL